MQQFSKLLRQIVDRTGATVIFASHDLNWAAAYSDRMLVMRDGALAADLPPAELMQSDRVRELFGFDAYAVTSGTHTWIDKATDLFGLGDYEVLRERMRNAHPDAAYWTGLADRRGFEVVAVYPSTIGAETPPEWLLAGWWTLPRRTVTAFEPRFEFWATTPEALFRLQDELRAFTADLPDGVDVTINDPAAVEATQMAAAALAITPEG